MRRNRTRLATEHDDLLAAIRPSIERQNEFEGIPAQDDGIYCIYEFLVTIIFLGRGALGAGQPIEVTIGPGNESVEAGRDEHRRLDAHELTPQKRLLETAKIDVPIDPSQV